MEKLEDLRDVNVVKRLKEGNCSDYFKADQVTALFKN